MNPIYLMWFDFLDMEDRPELEIIGKMMEDSVFFRSILLLVVFARH
jgi:hypothetical protein